MSFSKKKIEVTIALGEDQYGEDGADVVTLTGYRTTATIAHPGGSSMGSLQLRVYGLSESLMNRLTVIGPVNTQVRRNRVLVSAGDEESGMSEVFGGTIDRTWRDSRQAPEVYLNIIALAGLFEIVKPIPPRSYNGPVDVALIMADLAKQIGAAFENNGVSVQLSNPYLPGTAWMQIQAAAIAAKINVVLERGVLAIWPKEGARAGGIPVISPETGLVGYPSFSSNGLELTSVFNPNVVQGGQVDVGSSLLGANGRWNVNNVVHAIDAEVPNGNWFTHIQGFPVAGQLRTV